MGYVRNTYGCHCFYGDSSFKRYNRALGGDTLIFNYNSNNTYNCCGGHGGGFWGGLGMGLGMGFGNFLGGFCGNLFGGFGNMFGGFGMGNMFGGFPSWGGFGNWGFGGTPAASSNNNTSTTKTVTVTKENKDHEEINKLSKEVADLIAKNNQGTASKADIDALKAKIQAKLDGTFDGIQDDLDKSDLSAELRKLDNIVIGKPDTSDLTVIINRIDGDLSDDDISALIAGFDKLDDDQKAKVKTRLIALLKGLERTGGGYKVPRDYSSLLKLELLSKLDPSIEVYVENYDSASDKWIKGSIANVTKDENGNINYWVDCEKTGDKIKAQWRFTTQENSDKAKITGTIANDSSTKYRARIGMEYEWDSTKECYVNKNGKVTGSTTM